MNWNKPEALEIRMDAEISSYQDDGPDPGRDGPVFRGASPSATIEDTPDLPCDA